jgi:tetratricopeptide (TPR) repeat protein
MADTEQVGKKHRQALQIAGLVVVIVLAVGAGVGLRLLQNKDVAVPNPTLTLPKVVDDLQNLRDTGDEAAFNTALDKALHDPSLDSKTRYLVYIQQGHKAMQDQQWQAAIDAYSKAMAIKQDKEVAALLGDAYAALGDKTKAIEFYTKAISLIPSDNPNRDGFKLEYELRIQELVEGTSQP